MRTRTTSRGQALTEIALGTAPLGNLYRALPDEQAAATIDAAWDAGTRCFDTAPHYGLGLAERRLGLALRQRPRDDYVLSTKVGRVLEPDPDGAGRLDDEGFVVPASTRRRFDFSRDGVLRSVEDSLDRLGLDRIDVLLLHDPDDHLEQASTTGAAALVELREQGVVRAIGAGMNRCEPLAELVRRCDLDLVLVAGRFTLLEQGALDDLLPLAQERGVGVIAGGVLNSGLLSTDEPAADAMFDYAPAPPAVRARARRLAAVCRAHGVPLPQVAIAAPLRHPAVVSVALGMASAEEVRENVVRYDAGVPDALWDDLVDQGLLRTS